jgi:hypothetical protein
VVNGFGLMFFISDLRNMDYAINHSSRAQPTR